MAGDPAWIHGYAQVPAWALVDPRLSDGERATLSYVIARIFNTSYALSVAEITAYRRKKDVRAIQRHLRRLVELGYLECEQRTGHAARYSRGPALESPPAQACVRPLVLWLDDAERDGLLTSDERERMDSDSELRRAILKRISGHYGISELSTDGEQTRPPTLKSPPTQKSPRHESRGTPDSEVTRPRHESRGTPDSEVTHHQTSSRLVADEEQTTARAHARERPSGSRKKKPSKSDRAIADPRVIEVMAYYREALDRTEQYKLTSKRARMILDRLKGADAEPRSVDELKHAIDGLARSNWHRQGGYIGIEYALRSEHQVAQMIARANGGLRRSPSTPQKALDTEPDQWADVAAE